MTAGPPDHQDLVAMQVPAGVCSYCAAEFDSADGGYVSRCPACLSTYHGDCYAEAGGCIAPGCSERTAHSDTGPPPSDPFVAGGSTELAGPAMTPASPPPAPLVPTGYRRARAPVGRTIFVGIAMLLLGLAGGVVATKANVLSSVVGRTYEASDVDRAREAGVRVGYENGDKAGYARGERAGYARGETAGYSRGMTAGCRAVFRALGATRVVDYYDWQLNLRYVTYASETQC